MSREMGAEASGGQVWPGDLRWEGRPLWHSRARWELWAGKDVQGFLSVVK